MIKWLTGLFTGSQSQVQEYSLINQSGLNIEVSGFSPGLLSTYSGFIQNKLAQLKNLNFGKWDYTGKGIDWERLEQFLFFFGRCVVHKVKDEYLIDNFSVVKFGANDRPEIVSIKRKSQGKTNTYKLTVGQECVIFYADSGFLLGKTFLGVVFRIWQKLHNLERCFLELNKNVMLSNNKITVPLETSNEVFNDLSSAILDPNVVMRLAKQSGLTSPRDTKLDGVLLRIEDRTVPLIATYKFIWFTILEELGFASNPDSKKERMVNSEISNNNQNIDLYNKSCLRMRKKSIDEANQIFGNSWGVELFTPEENQEVVEDQEEINNE